MPSQVLSSVENNFTKGLVTEFTGLNFPENAATDTDNCTYTLVGDVLRREGIDLERNHGLTPIDITGAGINTYKWDNAGGEGQTQLIVTQVGDSLHFWSASGATITNPLSTQVISTIVFLPSFVANTATFDKSKECQFADGNGYLFVFHPDCEPIYCTYTPASGVTGHVINLQIRDFAGISYLESPANIRPVNLSIEHQYNLMNQGWSSGPTWLANYTNTWTIATGVAAFTVQAGITGVTVGTSVTIQSITGTYGGFSLPIPPGTIVGNGSVVSYAGTTLTINVTVVGAYAGFTTTTGNIFPLNVGYINTFKSTQGVYPSNSDVWWYFKNATGVFDPTATVPNVTLAQGNAPQGSFLLNPFFQDRTAASSVQGLTRIFTPKRPTNGTWFQGRLWYTGVEASQPATGDAPFYTWTENIYFSQIVNGIGDFGKCYQENDPTSEQLFDLLPTDGGVIVIQGSGTIYKLFPIQNGMLVHAANGIWFITGSQGIGFSATDYTITKISSVKAISNNSFVNVQGLPYFWNEEGIYTVQPSQQGGLEVNPITVGTILSFYNQIPMSNKKLARGDYNPIEYVIQWVYKSDEVGGSDPYSFDRILNYNTYNKAFFPYSVDNINDRSIKGINYVAGPGGVSVTLPTFKYLCSFPDVSNTLFSFADEHDTTYVDWGSTSTPVDYSSYFVTGFKLHGQGQRRFQIPYIYVFSRSDEPTSYYIQGIWDYATSTNSGRFSVAQLINNWSPNFGMIFRRHKIRGRGLVLQIKVTSVSGQPFDILGWSTFETQNTGV